MKKIKLFGALLSVMLLAASCKTSNDVMTHGLIQKRKYNKGFFISKAKKINVTKNKEQLQIDPSRVIQAKRDEIKIASAPTAPMASLEQNLAPRTETGQETSSFSSTNQVQAVKSDHIQITKGFEKVAVSAINPLSKSAKKTSPNSPLSGSSQILALVLCFFVGLLGIHRMYLGYIGIGILQLVTLGGFGIWTLIDFIRILIGDLGPANGSYS
jgi:hypothetical protein